MHEAEDGAVRRLTYAELRRPGRPGSAAGLRAHGVGKGDAVALYLPMTPEAVVAIYAVASLGAMVVPLFSGFAPTAIASRIQDADAKAVIIADGRYVRPSSPYRRDAAAARRGADRAARPCELVVWSTASDPVEPVATCSWASC